MSSSSAQSNGSLQTEGQVGSLQGQASFDPSRPIVGEDGLEYEDLGDLLLGRPVNCARNDVIRSLEARFGLQTEGQAPDPARTYFKSWEEAVVAQYLYQNRYGESRTGGSSGASHTWAYPQFHPRFIPVPSPKFLASSPRGPEGAGEPGAVQAPADPVHPAD